MAQRSKRDLKVRAFAVKNRDGADVTAKLHEISPYNSRRLGRQLECIDRQLATLQEFALAAGDTINVAALTRAFHRYQRNRQRICLFNIIVALEWTPSVGYLEDLKAAFAQASKLLADATDGYMAIGQVTVGGKELMACADIQIFASNRLFPRSSVDGLNNPEKYQPIRLGRGLWNRNQRVTIPWDSQKGYATIVHEWGHYALGLKDQYLKLEPSNGLVLPQNQLASDTIMARLDRSELLDGSDAQALVNDRQLVLLSPRDNVQDDDPASEWEALRQHSRYDWLGINPNHKKEEEPPPEEVIPAFHIIGTADDPFSPRELLFSLQDAGAGEQKIAPVHCWVFVLKGTKKDATGHGFVAQGQLEDGGQLRLFGAQKGDEVVLIGHAQNEQRSPLVLRARITDDSGGSAQMGAWQDATPRPFPVLDIAASGASAAPPYTIDLPGLNRTSWDATAFPLGRQRRDANAAVAGLDVLDGHVMLASKGEGGEKKLAIAGYALGGSPFSGYPGHPNPIPAGSADGNALVLFYNEDDAALNYTNIYPSDGSPAQSNSDFDASKVVVTTNLQNDTQPPTGWSPRSYTFSLTSNRSFHDLATLHPTLVLFFDQGTLDSANSTLIIGRYDRSTDSWVPLETTLKVEDFFAAASLQKETYAPGLFANPPRPELFRLFLVPQSSS